MLELLVGVLFAVLAAASFGSANVLIRVGMQHVETMTGIFVSLVTGTVLTLIVALVMDAQAIVAVSLTALLGLAVLAFLEFVLGRFFIFSGLRLAGVAIASVFLGTEPIYSALLANIFLGEQVTLLIGLGILAVVVGIAIVLTAPELRSGGQEAASNPTPDFPLAVEEQQAAQRRRLLLGILAATMAGVAFASTRALARYLVITGAPPQIGAFYTALFGMVYYVALTGRKVGRLFEAPRPALVAVAASGVCASLGSLFIFLSLSRAPVTLASPVLQLKSLFGIMLAHFFLKRLEKVTFRLVFGAVLVFVGVVLVILG